MLTKYFNIQSLFFPVTGHVHEKPKSEEFCAQYKVDAERLCYMEHWHDFCPEMCKAITATAYDEDKPLKPMPLGKDGKPLPPPKGKKPPPKKEAAPLPPPKGKKPPPKKEAVKKLVKVLSDMLDSLDDKASKF